MKRPNKKYSASQILLLALFKREMGSGLVRAKSRTFLCFKTYLVIQVKSQNWLKRCIAKIYCPGSIIWKFKRPRATFSSGQIAGYFICHEVTEELARFHDYLLIECIVNGRDTLCAACPADSKPLQGLSTDEQRSYCETGYVFAGAGSELAKRGGVPWRAFTIPHFTLGVIDWLSRPAEESAEMTQHRIVSQLRTKMQELHFDKCRFEKLVIFRVQPGGVYVPSADNTCLEEYGLG